MRSLPGTEAQAAGLALVHPLAVPRRVTGTYIVPPQWRADIQEVLIPEDRIQRRVQELARVLTRAYVGTELVVVALLNGTVMFLADLMRHLAFPLKLDLMGVSSYRDATAARELIVTKELRLDVQGREVLLVDDILDTGRTVALVRDKLARLNPRRLRLCVLLDKPSRRTEPVQADFAGFEIPDLFVVGYGLDFAERYRNLPFVGVLHPHLYRELTRPGATPSPASPAAAPAPPRAGHARRTPRRAPPRTSRSRA